MSDRPLIRIRDLHKVYRVGVERVHALRGIDLDVYSNEYVAVMGASGSGKSTLMNIIGCLDRPTRGTYELAGHPTHRLSAAELARVRNREIGFVFQSFELLSRASALKNVMLPLVYSPRNWRRSRQLARQALERVGLGARLRHRPSQLSGGEKQRVAIARALVNGPSLLLADEPTGNLDSQTSRDILNLFAQLHAAGQTIIIVTHEEDVAGCAQRIVRLRDGQIVSDYPVHRDPVHREYLDRMAAAARAAAEADGMDTVRSSPTVSREPAP